MQKIFIPKTPNDIKSTTFKIRVKDIDYIKNDCLLIFRVNNLRTKDIVYNKNFSVERFSLIYKNGIDNLNKNNDKQIEASQVNNLTSEDMLLFQKEFGVINDENMKYLGIGKKV